MLVHVTTTPVVLNFNAKIYKQDKTMSRTQKGDHYDGVATYNKL